MEKATARVAVLYASDYGFSDRLSQTLARGITKVDVAVEMLDILSADPQVRLLPCATCCCPSCFSVQQVFAASLATLCLRGSLGCKLHVPIRAHHYVDAWLLCEQLRV